MDNRERLIRERAYVIWESEGRPHGCEAEHWERARRELDDEARSSTPAAENAAWEAAAEENSDTPGGAAGAPEQGPADQATGKPGRKPTRRRSGTEREVRASR